MKPPVWYNDKVMADPKKILVVDDEKDLLMILSTRLKIAGYVVTTATNGAEGLGMVMADKPDLVVLDLMMPKMDGWEVLKNIRQNDTTRDLPVILLTAKGDMHTIDESKRQLATDYFIKPYEMNELLAFIQRYLK